MEQICSLVGAPEHDSSCAHPLQRVHLRSTSSLSPFLPRPTMSMRQGIGSIDQLQRLLGPGGDKYVAPPIKKNRPMEDHMLFGTDPNPKRQRDESSLQVGARGGVSGARSSSGSSSMPAPTPSIMRSRSAQRSIDVDRVAPYGRTTSVYDSSRNARARGKDLVAEARGEANEKARRSIIDRPIPQRLGGPGGSREAPPRRQQSSHAQVELDSLDSPQESHQLPGKTLRRLAAQKGGGSRDAAEGGRQRPPAPVVLERRSLFGDARRRSMPSSRSARSTRGRRGT